MIRFCDKEIYSVLEDGYTRSSLFQFFCSENHNTDIISVYSNIGEFKGIITYDRLLNNIDDNSIIQKEYALTTEDNIWDVINRILEENKTIMFLPILNKHNELISFAYNDKNQSDVYLYTERVFDQIENMKNGLFIYELYPKIKAVCIYDLNEWSFRFYKICINKGVTVLVQGNKWEEILGVKNHDIQYIDSSIMRIYSEGTEMIHEDINRNNFNNFRMVYSFSFLAEILTINRIHAQNEIKKEFKKQGKNIFLCRIPRFDELQSFTYEEFYRNRNNVHHTKIYSNDPKVIEQFKKVCGDNYVKTKEKIQDMSNRWYEIIDKLEYQLARKKYGFGDNYIYILGPCIVDSYQDLTCDEGKKLTDYIQMYLNESIDFTSYAVISITLPGQIADKYYDVINSLSLKTNDIILCIDESAHFMKRYNLVDDVDIDLTPIYNERTGDSEWFLERPMHTTQRANQIIAKWIVEKYLVKIIRNFNFVKEQLWLQKSSKNISMSEKENLQRYLNSINKFNCNNNEKIGSIVMNCNPFTLGHKYLIDYARKKVDYLYIFVVEENRSIFQFEDRIELVKQGIKEWANVKVFPSGRYILSYNTMPIYFEKDKKKEEIIDASEDIELFAQYIAPKLNITVRFAGTEPLDRITLQYNYEMRRTLSEFDIEFIEIPRLENGGQVISASLVRQKLGEKRWDEISELVPDTTLKFLIEKFG